MRGCRQGGTACELPTPLAVGASFPCTSAWSARLMGASNPFRLLPAVPVVTQYTVVSVRCSGLRRGPAPERLHVPPPLMAITITRGPFENHQ